jgi:hypothetical protein
MFFLSLFKQLLFGRKFHWRYTGYVDENRGGYHTTFHRTGSKRRLRRDVGYMTKEYVHGAIGSGVIEVFDGNQWVNYESIGID